MYRFSLLTGGALALALLMTSSASAQFGGRGMQFPPSVQNIMLLRQEAVQKELGIKEDQQKALTDLATQMQADAMEIFSGLQDLSAEEREKEMPGLMKMINEKGKELQGKVDKLLDEKQVARMKELSIQSRGAEALEDEEVAKALKITDEQKKKLVDIKNENADKQQEIIKDLTSGGGDRAAGMQKLQALRTEMTEKANGVLTPDQKAAFEKMKGAKFDFPRQGGPGRRPG